MMTEKDLNLIRKIVWSFVKKYPGLEFDDLYGEACYHYVRAIPDYDPEKGAKSTYLWRFISNGLNNVIHGPSLRPQKEELFAEVPLNNNTPTPEQVLIAKEHWNELIDSLSPEARVIYDMVLNREDLDLPLDTPKLARGEIKRALRDEGMTWRSIWSGFREIKAALAE